MAPPIWPFFDLRVVTPRLELVAIDDHVAVELAQLAAKGIHDPDFMPFAFEWTDVPSPQLERNTLQFYWRTRAELSPAAWNLNLAARVDGHIVGTTGLMAHQFPVTRTVETGSWLGREFQGLGIGKEMRIATLHLGFLGFDACTATTAAFHDNGPSLGVTRSLGYEPNGSAVKVRRGEAATSLQFIMSRERFAEHLQRDDIVLHGVEPCLPLLGL
jgi:RimJ/RimL family protein N-acetyltransferase